MFPDNILFKLATHFGYLLLFFLVLLALCHIVFIWLYPLGKVGWKRSDYFWLTIAALGLVKSTGDVRTMLAENYSKHAQDRVVFAIDDMRRDLTPESYSYLCTKFNKSKMSPPNLDEIQREHDLACEWIKGIQAFVPNSSEPPFKKITFNDTKPPSVKTVTLVQTLGSIKNRFDEYESRRREYEKLTAMIPKTEGEATQLLMSPILLCLALAIRMTKVTGEVRLEKTKT